VVYAWNRWWPAGALLAATLGCAASNGKFAQLAQEKSQLVATIESERKLNAELQSKLQLASQRAADAERELALVHGDHPKSNLVSATIPRGAPPASLADIAKNNPLLQYNASRRAARVQAELTFNDDQRPSYETRRTLHRVADCLAGQAGRSLAVRITGPADAAGARQAAAIADFFRERGIPSDHILVAAGDSGGIDEEGRQLPGGARGVGLSLVELGDASGTVAQDPNRTDGWTNSGRR
jgi:hypothetical protein